MGPQIVNYKSRIIGYEKVAGGQVPADENARLLAELSNSVNDPWCGMACCMPIGASVVATPSLIKNLEY